MPATTMADQFVRKTEFFEHQQQRAPLVPPVSGPSSSKLHQQRVASSVSQLSIGSASMAHHRSLSSVAHIAQSESGSRQGDRVSVQLRSEMPR